MIAFQAYMYTASTNKHFGFLFVEETKQLVNAGQIIPQIRPKEIHTQ